MQIELTLTADAVADYSARDLGFLLHKHPEHLHIREVTTGCVSIFSTENSAQRSTVVTCLEVDPVGL